MDRLLAHDLKERLHDGKGLVRAARHEGQRPRRRPADTARDRGIDGQKPRLHRLIGDRAGAVHIDCGTIAKDRARRHRGDNLFGDRAQDGAVRQHGDDDARPRDRPGGAGGGGDVIGHRGGGVKACHLMPRLDEVGRHRRAHVAKSDECDLHGVSSANESSSGPSDASIHATSPSGTASGPPCRHCGLRSLSMICARMPSRKSACSMARKVKRYSC